MPKRIDMTGQRVGKLTVIKEAGYVPHHSALWLCRCDCGKEKVIRADSLRRAGNTRSCGCLQRETVGNLRRKHGAYGTAEYATWQHMTQRCRDNPSNDNFRRYVLRSIKVCKRWESFENFLSDMGTRPSHKHTIERIDNDKGYSPDNCKWATYKEQNRNHSRNVYLEHHGVRLCLADWSSRLGWTHTTLSRWVRMGRPIDKILIPKTSFQNPFFKKPKKPRPSRTKAARLARMIAAAHKTS